MHAENVAELAIPDGVLLVIKAPVELHDGHDCVLV